MANKELNSIIARGEELFASGDVHGALNVFRAVLDEDPQNVAAMNDAAVCFWELGEVVQAAELFETVLEADTVNEQAFYNLIDLLAQSGADDLAKDIFVKHADDMQSSPQKDQYSKALSGVRSSEIPTSIDVPDHDALNIAIICGPDDKFINDIDDEIAKRHNVRRIRFGQKVELIQIQEAMDWADVAWFEWCDAILMHASTKLRKTCPVVCRLHSYETFSEIPSQVNWKFVDHVVFVADHIQKIFYSTFHIDVHSTVIPNGVDLDNLKFKERSTSFDIAYVGYLNYKKNPELLLQCMAHLVDIDDRYKLYIAGSFQDLRYALYYEKMIPELGLTQNVKYDGWVDDIDAWLEDKSYLVSTSVLESFGMGIAEAMAKGIKPVIHNWVGADAIYPAEQIFNTPAGFANLILEDAYDSQAYRAFIEQRYALGDQVAKIADLLQRLAAHGTEAVSGDAAGETDAVSAGLSPSRRRFDLPERNLIVTGIPRSGTSLFSVIVNQLENAVCLNEILYDMGTLANDFAELRRRLASGEPIPNKYRSDGTLTTNTQEDHVDVRSRIIEGVDENVLIGSKINVPYLVHLGALIEAGYKIVAIVRDPIYTIGSWASTKAGNIPEAQVTDDDLHPRWHNFEFASTNRFERQAQIWEQLARTILTHREQIQIYTYEQLVSETKAVLADFCSYADLAPSTEAFELQSMNSAERYAGISDIRQAVEKYAPSRLEFGFGSAEPSAMENAA